MAIGQLEFPNHAMKRSLCFLLAMMILPGLTMAQQKVSDGGTASGAPPAATTPEKDAATRDKERREAARKALEALKGQKGDKPAGSDKPAGR